MGPTGAGATGPPHEPSGGSASGADPGRLDHPVLSAPEQAELYRSIAESSPIAAVASDLAGNLLWANPMAEELFGWPAGQLVGAHYTELVAEDIRESLMARRRTLLAGEPITPFVTRGRRLGGEEFDLYLAISTRHDADGEVVGTHTLFRDVTEEQRLQRELTEELNRSRARFEQSATPQSLISFDRTFADVNDAGCRLLQRSREELIGASTDDLFRAEDPAQVHAWMDQMSRGEIESATYVTFARLPDGSEVPVHAEVALVRDEQGRPAQLASAATDLSALREAQNRTALFDAIYHNSSDAALVIDRDACISYVTPALTEVMGYGPDQVLGQNCFAFVHPEDEQAAREQIATVMAQPGRTERILLRIGDANGTWRWFDDRARNYLDEPGIEGVVINLLDVTSEVEAQQALEDSEMRFRAIASTAQEGIVAVGPEGRLMFANERLGEILGIPLAELYAETGAGLLTELTARGPVGRLTEPPGSPRRYDVDYTRPDGGECTLNVVVSALMADHGTALGSLAMVSDVTLERAVESRLRRQALHDHLTSLPNRALFMDRLSQAAARFERSPGAGVAVLFIDLDQFKLVNDSYGHGAGDRLLQQVARRIREAVRGADTVARLGGDEFAVICEATGPDDAELVAARIQETMKDPVDLGDQTVQTTVSIGIALAPPGEVSQLLAHADAAMYRAKTSGGAQVQLFTPRMAEEHQREVAVSRELRGVLAARELALTYQPVLDLGTHTVIGLHADLDWEQPRLGPVASDEIRDAAAAAGLSYDLDRAVALLAAHDFARLRERGTVSGEAYVSIRLSEATTEHTRLEELTDEVLRTGLPASALVWQVTEPMLVSTPDRLREVLGWLNERGVRLEVAEFGRALQSLAFLRSTPLSALRIAAADVEGVDGGTAEGPEAARHVVALAARLGERTIAEDVVSPEHEEQLRELGFTSGQGVRWGSAVRIEAVADLLRRIEG